MRSKIFFLLSLDIPIDHKPVHRAVVVAVVVVMSISRGVSLNICRSRKNFLSSHSRYLYLSLCWPFDAVLCRRCCSPRCVHHFLPSPLSDSEKFFFFAAATITNTTHHRQKRKKRVKHTLRDLLQTVVSHDCGI